MHKIILNGTVYEYQLNRRRQKNMTARVRNGELIVNAPSYVPIEEIEQFLQKHQMKFSKSLDEFVPLNVYEDGGYVTLWGKRYTIVQVDISRNIVEIHGERIFVYSRNIEATLKKYMKKRLEDYIDKRIDEYLRSDFDLPKPSMKVKTYSARWGSCYYNINSVTFALALIHYETDAIDSVIVHELCHFLAHGHDKAFYNEVYKRMPDYDIKHSKLEGNH